MVAEAVFELERIGLSVIPTGQMLPDLLIGVRMSRAAKELKKPGVGAEALADRVGYQVCCSIPACVHRHDGDAAGRRWLREARSNEEAGAHE